tara:strand:+ start:6822 stop:7577 length:756 start_codon:yes stop_codon:yes gene_type:complete
MFDFLINIFVGMGRFIRFIMSIMSSVVSPYLWVWQTVVQINMIGVGSLFLICIASIFIGLVFTFQMYMILNKFSGLSQLSSVVAFGIFRELSPVVTGLLIAGRVGSTVAAELSQLRQSEQVDSLLMWGISPYAYLMLPRFLAGIVCLPVLVLVFDAISIYSSWAYAVLLKGMENQIFWNPLLDGNVFFEQDVLYGLYKSMFFGGLIISVALFQGFYVKRGVSGMAQSSTKAVVYASLGILAMDYLLSQLLY